MTTAVSLWLTVVVAMAVHTSQAAVIWDNPALAQFPSQWVNSQLQPRHSTQQRANVAAAVQKIQQQPSSSMFLANNIPAASQPQSLSPFELEQQQEQLSALLAPYLSPSAAAVNYPSPSAFSRSTLNFDNSLTGDGVVGSSPNVIGNNNNDIVVLDANDLIKLTSANGNNDLNDALSPYAMDLLREAYLAQVPVAEFKPIYGDNKLKAADLKTSTHNNNKLVPTNLDDIERMFYENMFGPIAARDAFKSFETNNNNKESGRKAAKAESKPYVETSDNINRNTYSKLTSEELKLNAEKRLSDVSSQLFGDGGAAASGGGSAFGSSAHAMFAGKSRLGVMAIVFACTGAAVFGVVAAATFYRSVKSRRGGLNGAGGNDSNYPAYGVTGPIKPPSSLDLLSAGDRKLAKSAETYHYQNQKRAMLANERHAGLGAGGKSAAQQAAGGVAAGDESDSDLDDGSECGDYTVYECPGLAPAGCMEVQNPLFIGSDAESISPRSDRAEE